jgi:hypothetical protein
MSKTFEQDEQHPTCQAVAALRRCLQNAGPTFYSNNQTIWLVGISPILPNNIRY